MKQEKKFWCRDHNKFHAFSEIEKACYIEFWNGQSIIKKRFKSVNGYAEEKSMGVDDYREQGIGERLAEANWS